MANSRSARKRIRANERKHIRNRGVRSSVRTYVGKARQSLLAIEPGQTVDVEEQLRAAVRALDRAGEKGILHRNNVNRRKSRLTAMAARLIRAASEGGEHATEVRAAAAGGAKGRGRATKRATAKAPANATSKAPAKVAGKAPPKTAGKAAGAAPAKPTSTASAKTEKKPASGSAKTSTPRKPGSKASS